MSKACTVPQGPNAGYSHSKLKYLEEKKRIKYGLLFICFFFFLARIRSGAFYTSSCPQGHRQGPLRKDMQGLTSTCP